MKGNQMAIMVEGKLLSVVTREFKDKETGEVSTFNIVHLLVASPADKGKMNYDLLKLYCDYPAEFEPFEGKEVMLEVSSYHHKATGQTL
jgi:hypothetical protein